MMCSLDRKEAIVYCPANEYGNFYDFLVEENTEHTIYHMEMGKQPKYWADMQQNWCKKKYEQLQGRRFTDEELPDKW